MIREIAAVAVTGTWWRHVPAGGDPAPHSEIASSGRWQLGGLVGGLYLASDRDTCLAEWYRRLDAPPPPPRGLRT